MTRQALISVSDKRGVVELGRGLERLGWSLISTGGTARALREGGCRPTEVSELTGFPEILDGRVKTLHPKVFAGILAAPIPAHEEELARQGIAAIDLVVVNLYPFRETVARPGVTADEAVEQVDIGGPSLLRAAAKNHARVTVVVDPDDYPGLLGELEHGAVGEATRRRLALKAFRHTAAYDAAISAALPQLLGERQSPAAEVAAALLGGVEESLRYGENPHQWGLLVRTRDGSGLASARKLQGKELSYNNLGDASGAWRAVCDLPGPGVVIVKHANPCGVGLADDMAEAFRKAKATDPVSAFGGVIAANRPVDAAFAEAVADLFAEVVLAPAFDEGAVKVLAKKKNLRVLACDGVAAPAPLVRSVDGGYLLQQGDHGWDGEERRVVTRKAPPDTQLSALELAWRIVKHAGSNAIVVGIADRILGVGAGQTSRVESARIAVGKARELGHDLAGSAAASDAFFPFPDGVEVLAAAGVTAVIQPGGSMRDEEVIAAADRLGIAMVLTGRRHFRH